MKHYLSIDDLTREDLLELLSLTDTFAQVLKRDVPIVSALRGKRIVMGFFENSTRTKLSFDLAAKSLSAGTMPFQASSSSTQKGESLKDTIESIDAMGVDMFVVRHASAGVPKLITNWTEASVISAGDGAHQHPTQALLDCYTITIRLGSLQGKRIAVCGDLDQRVTRSNLAAFTKLGAEVVVCGPNSMIPPYIESSGIKVVPSIDEILGDVDVIYMVRIQKERKGKVLLPSLREYRHRYGLTIERSKLLKDDCLIMHPGPINRGVELDQEVTDDPRSVVLDQITAGVPARMAVMFKLLGSESQIESIKQNNGEKS